MSRKICTAGVVGPFSFVVLDEKDSAIASIRSHLSEEIIARHIDVEHATSWTEQKIRELNGKHYEDD